MNNIITVPGSLKTSAIYLKRFFLASVCIMAVMFTSCKNDSSSTVTRFNVKLTDAPGAYDALYLSVKEVQVFTSEGQTIMEVDGAPFDILKFRMGKDTLIASEDIPSGKLQEVRLVLNETGNEVVIDDQSYELKTPSGQSSGVKLKVQEDLTSGVAYTLILDFDAAKSVVKTGNGKYILKPVIRAIPQAVSGGLTGVVSPASSDPKVYVITGVDTIGTVTDATGKFFFSGLAAGNYQVDIEPQDSTYAPKTIENVAVTTGSVKDLGIITVTQ